MNVVIGKIGKSLLFDPKSWGLVGGDSAPAILYTNLANMNPQDNFYIIGKSDFDRLTDSYKERLFPNGNVHYCMPNDDEYKDPDFSYMHAVDWLDENEVDIDTGIVFNGMVGGTNIPNKIVKQKDPSVFTKPYFMMRAYSANVIHTLNDLDVPYALISEDPRYIDVNGRDLFNRPKIILSQCNGSSTKHHILSYERQLETDVHEVPVVYAETEKIFLMGENPIDVAEIEKKYAVNAFMNGHGMSKGESRYDFVKEYVLDSFEYAKVYGNWPKELYETGRFVKKRMGDAMDIVMGTKYTPVVSIKPGFVTCKPFEMLNWGILPFMHDSYDSKDLVGFDPYLIISSADEFKEKVNMLESRPNIRIDFLKAIYDQYMTDEYFNGTRLNNKYMSILYELVGQAYQPVQQNEFIKISNFQSNERFQNNSK